MAVRGIRGAVTVEGNTPEAIAEATGVLLEEMIVRNAVDHEEIASAFFTTTPDLTADFPAYAARQRGWLTVPLICGHEMNVAEALPLCIRVLLHVNTDRAQKDMRHVYLRGAVVLRRDLVERFGQSDSPSDDEG